METVYRDYAPKGVKFYYMYKSLAHLGLMGYIGPVTLQERLMHIQEAKRTLGTEMDFICDSMDNRLKHAIGDASNSEYVLDPDGEIVRMCTWSDPVVLRRDLEALVGPVERPTQVSDLNLPVEEPLKAAPTGIIPRLKLEGEYVPLKTQAQVNKSQHPFYVKLRAEADRDVLDTGKGKVYLGFFLDPIYHVFWNNQVAPVQYEIVGSSGITVSPTRGVGPTVDAPKDGDPREFLLDVDRGNSTEPIRLILHYFGCTDRWCTKIAQEYNITWEVDRDGGRRYGYGGQRRDGDIDPRSWLDPQAQ